MDSEQLLDRIQNLLLGMEERVDARLGRMDARFDKMDARFDKMDARFDRMDARFDGVDARLDSLSREVTLHNQLLAPFITWAIGSKTK